MCAEYQGPGYVVSEMCLLAALREQLSFWGPGGAIYSCNGGTIQKRLAG